MPKQRKTPATRWTYTHRGTGPITSGVQTVSPGSIKKMLLRGIYPQQESSALMGSWGGLHHRR